MIVFREKLDASYFWGYHVMFLYDKEVNVREDPGVEFACEQQRPAVFHIRDVTNYYLVQNGSKI